MNQLHDIKGPVSFPVNIWPWVIVGLFILIVGGILLFKLLKSRKSRRQTFISQDPWDLAYEQLNQLERGGLLNQGKFKEYFSQLSDISRRYLEARFSIRAPEMTTEEFLISLKQTQHLNSSQKESLKEFLILCDLVKFAKFEPQMQDGEKGLQLVKRLVDETKEVSQSMS